MKKPRRTLYHYTSLSSFFSIVSNIKTTEKEENLNLWATHIDYFNDPSEYTILYDACCEMFSSKQSKDNSKNSSSIESIIERNEIDKPFIFSLSEKCDSLYMWQNYSENGQGVCLGFDEDKLKSNKDSGFELKRCKYFSKPKILKSLNEIYGNQMYKLLLKSPEIMLHPLQKIDVKGDKLFINTKVLNSLLDNEAEVYKHFAYKHEKEHRIVAKRKIQEINFRVRNNIIIPYITICIPTDCINEIYIGPCANMETTQNSIEQLFKNIKSNNNAFPDIEIKTSRVPYRVA